MIAVCPLTDGLAMWLEPAPPGTVLRMLARALRETITRRPVTMPLAGKPGDFAGLTAPEALPGFEHVTAGRPWRNEISTSWLFPLAAFRPVTVVPRIAAPVLYQIAQHDRMLPAGAVDKAIPCTPGPRSGATPRTTSDLSAPNTTPPPTPTPAEQRRLFYAALTRARREVTLITPTQRISAFVAELLQNPTDPDVAIAGAEEVPVDICPRCGKRTLVQRKGPYSIFLGCSTWPRCNYKRTLQPASGRPAQQRATTPPALQRQPGHARHTGAGADYDLATSQIDAPHESKGPDR